jgi:hypothetical protein
MKIGKMRTNEIKNVLMKTLYSKGRGLFCTNFQGCGFAECDVIRITESNIVYEYEIKTSRSDFKADFKKTYKHNRLSGVIQNDKEYIQWNGYPGRANHFYYVCAEDLIKETEVPQYAGLIYVTASDIKVIKKAPKLHSFKASEKLIRTIALLLSARFVFGCSYMTYINRQNK